MIKYEEWILPKHFNKTQSKFFSRALCKSQKGTGTLRLKKSQH